MAKKTKLTKREKAFLRIYAETGNLSEAGTRIGLSSDSVYTFSAVLLESPAAVRYLKKCISEREQTVRQGLARLAFAKSNDAVSLALSEEPPSNTEINKMDLFCISELKKIKGGGVEMKFTNRFEALKLLSELEQSDSSGNSLNKFIGAVREAVRDIPVEP